MSFKIGDYVEIISTKNLVRYLKIGDKGTIIDIGTNHNGELIFTVGFLRDDVVGVCTEENIKISENGEIELICDKYKGILTLLGKEDLKITGRDKIIEMINITLSQMNKPNVLLIGEAGVGKTAIVNQFAYQIHQEDNEFFKDYNVVELSVGGLIAGTRYRGDFEEKVVKILNDVSSKDIILYIDEMHTSNTAGGAEGAVSMGNLLKPWLTSGKIKVIGSTTINEYEKYLKTDKAYDRRFKKVILNEPSLIETVEMLKNSKRRFIIHYGIDLTDTIIEFAVNKARRLPGCNPDKSINIIENCMSACKINKKDYILCDDIIKAIEMEKGIYN